MALAVVRWARRSSSWIQCVFDFNLKWYKLCCSLACNTSQFRFCVKHILIENCIEHLAPHLLVKSHFTNGHFAGALFGWHVSNFVDKFCFIMRACRPNVDWKNGFWVNDLLKYHFSNRHLVVPAHSIQWDLLTE